MGTIAEDVVEGHFWGRHIWGNIIRKKYLKEKKLCYLDA